MVGQGHSIAVSSCRDRAVGDDGRNGGTWRATYLCAPCVLCATLANDPLVGSLADRGSADCGYRYVGPREPGLSNRCIDDTLSIAW